MGHFVIHIAAILSIPRLKALVKLKISAVLNEAFRVFEYAGTQRDNESSSVIGQQVLILLNDLLREWGRDAQL